MQIHEQLKNAISEALSQLGASEVSFSLEHPTELSHGDYATNAALASAKKLGKNPRDVANDLVATLAAMNISVVESVSVAGPGFINFFLKPEFFTQSVSEIISNTESFGKFETNKDQKILVEHSSPNLFKPFHIGHLMNNAIGESLARIAGFSGAQVRTMSFPSDISLGVAKAIFVILEKYGVDFQPTEISVLGDAYVEGTKRYDEDEAIHVRVKEIADNLYAEKDSGELKVFNLCKKFNISYFEGITARLGSHFDSYIYESEAGIIGKKIVVDNTPKVFTESEGAIVYVPDESQKHLNTAVFVNSQGNPTYEAKDVGLIDLKFERENPDSSIFITDYQQIPHFDVVLDAVHKISPQWNIWVDKSHHVPHGRMSFKGQKMSSRLGGVPLVSEILAAVGEDVRAKSEKNSDDKIVDMISIAAIKFSILRAKPGQNINFDPETSLSFEGDSGPYLQYTYARIQSVIAKASEASLLPKVSVSSHAMPTEIERTIYRFPEIVQSALSEYAPNYIATYLIEIARAFNSFYGANKIIDLENREISEHRLAIAQSVAVVLKNGLHLLGIEAPEKM